MSITTSAPTGTAPAVGTHRVGMPFPPDTRVRVTQTTQAPWSATGLVSARFPNGVTGEATGFVIGDRYVVTAAHAVYDKGFGGLAQQVNYEPARDAGDAPYGEYDANAWHIPDVYPGDERVRNDYCLLVLSSPVPPEIPRYRLVAADNKTLRDTEYQVAGYPDDKRPDNSMWYAAGRLTAVEPLLLQYRISTSGGQSGAAVASYLSTSTTVAVGIHSRVNSGATANVAVRITDQVIAQIDKWKSMA